MRSDRKYRMSTDMSRKAVRAFCTLCLALGMGLMVSCDEAMPVKPQSGGTPGEVLVMSDVKEMRGVVCGMLSQPVKGLPHEEPLFDVSQTDRTEWTQTSRYARLIVIVKADAKAEAQKEWGRTRIRYERNAFASPQLIVSVSAPTVQVLRRDSARVANTLLRLMDNFEVASAVASIRHHRNSRAEKAVGDRFGCHLDIPPELSSMKAGKDFLWLSDNGAESMCNVCIYTHPLMPLSQDAFVRVRDSVMAKNIPGERPGMYMATERRRPLHVAWQSRRTGASRRSASMWVRGLWQVENDAMGGPFVSLTVADSLHGRMVTVEAFVYAPAVKKRNKLKRMEAVLHTLHF